MPTSAPITFPTVWDLPENPTPNRDQQTDGSNTFQALQFVYMTSGALAECATAATAVYGLTPDESHTSTASPVDALWGQLHSVISPKNRFLVNITTTGGTVGSSTTSQNDVSIGTAYGLYLGSGNYDGIAFLNNKDTTNDFFKVEALYEGDATDAYNGRVICSIVDAVQQ